jgi:hypothetical protein
VSSECETRWELWSMEAETRDRNDEYRLVKETEG